MSCSTHRVCPTLKPILLLLVFILTVWLMPGCSIGSFIGAYFNTYYNAQRQFQEAVDELMAQRENKQADRSFGFAFAVSPNTKTKFAAVIEKCSKLLQYHSESSLVDDALLMIGKSYYYQNDYQQAERKFKELLEEFPNSGLVSEGELLLGYCYYMMNDKPKASGVAKILLDNATKQGDDAYAARASMLLAQIELDNKNIDQAATYYQAASDNAGSSEERCMAYLNLASLYVQEGNNQRALEAYRKAEGASTTFETAYKARIGEARSLSKLGGHEESLALLRDMLSSSNYKEYYGEISLEIANVFNESKEYPSAIAQYEYVDTSYARTESAAKSYFQLGDLYETKLFQFDSAFVKYSKGKSEFPQAQITQQLTERAEYLGKYIQYRNEIQKFDSIKTLLLSLPDTLLASAGAATGSTTDSLHMISTHVPAPSDSIADSLHTIGAYVPAPGDSTAHLANAVPTDSTLDSLKSKPQAAPKIVRPAISLDSVNARLAYDKTELAALFYTVMGLPDSAEVWYMDLLIEHPDSKQEPRALYTLAQIYSQDSTEPRAAADSLYRVLVEKFPESEFAPEAERQLGLPVREKAPDPALASYENAEKLISSGSTKAGRDTLRSIVRTYPSSPFASKAQYALGWVYESVDVVPDSAIANYRKLLSLYPGSQYALSAKPKVDEYDLFQKALQQRKDSIAAAVKDSLTRKEQEKEGSKEKRIEGGKEKEMQAPAAKDSAVARPREEEESPLPQPQQSDTSAVPGKDKKPDSYP